MTGPGTSTRSLFSSPRFLIGLPVLAVVSVFAWLTLPPAIWFWQYEPREGDILFQSLPAGSLTLAIEGSTHSPWSHCGIVARENNEWVVYEAYGTVQRVPLRQFWSRSRANQFGVYRFKAEHQKHVPAVLEQVRTCLGRPYDARYQMDDQKLYCSELIYKCWQRVTGEPMGELARLGDLDWRPYEAIIRRVEGGPPPLDRLMITPRDLARAPQLEHVRSFGVGQ